MSEPQIHESVVKADRWSKVIALFFALGVYYLALFSTDEIQFSMIVAAISAIGVRFYIPYHASVRLTDTEKGGIHEHPATGEFHHGAVAGALVVGPAVAVAVQLLEPNTTLSLFVGGVFAVGSFVIFRTVLDSG